MREQIITNVTAQPQRVRHAPQRGTLIWALNRASALALVYFLAVHIYFSFFATIETGNRVTFELVSRRFEAVPLIYALNSFGLLITALFHGLSGLRSVVYDVVTNATVRRIISVILLVIGLIALVDGTLSLLALMQMPLTTR
jgi:succinate dehydrogenase / fumarate reductase, membrane anchor subunit